MRLIEAMATYGASEDAVYVLHSASLNLVFGHDQYYYAARVHVPGAAETAETADGEDRPPIQPAPAAPEVLTSTFPEICLAWLREVAPGALTADDWDI